VEFSDIISGIFVEKNVKTNMANFPVRKAFAVVTSLAVLVTVGFGLFFSGSPAEQRKKRADEQRAQHLQQITYAVDNFWNKNMRLPESIQELQNSPDAYLTSAVDPSTAVPYEFRIVEPRKYELCATFESETENSSDPRVPKMAVTPEGQFWAHPAGNKCFQLEVRVYPKP
jgi:hypothetical protein